jgi:hypothetical protein
LTPTELVHDVYLRIAGDGGVTWEGCLPPSDDMLAAHDALRELEERDGLKAKCGQINRSASPGGTPLYTP